MQKILIVEDSKLVGSIIKNKIESELHFEAIWIKTYAETIELLKKDKPDFLICLVGLYLPDAPAGEIVDYLISRNMPTIVFTGEVSDDIRERIWSKKVIDYVYKESGHNLDYIVNLIRRIYRNRWIKVLVVDDSKIFRSKISDLLNTHRYNVFQAKDGLESLKIINQNPDIKMVITDYHMPNMDGLELVKEIRSRYSKEEMTIIGISDDNLISSKFIKLGANDFFSKDFFTEEFYCRITQNIELLEHMAEIKEASNRDYLTDIYNRRYFYDTGQKLFENSKRKNLTITVAMLDIDYFKKVNDKYGHDAGDLVLRSVAHILQNRFRASDIVSRIGGEEFCVLAANMKEESAHRIFDDLRQRIEKTEITTDNGIIKVTASIGICNKLMDKLDDMVKHADHMLYQAKESGRNKVMMG